jgi:hypothetical protein
MERTEPMQVLEELLCRGFQYRQNPLGESQALGTAAAMALALGLVQKDSWVGVQADCLGGALQMDS